MDQPAAARDLAFWGRLFMVGLPGPRLDPVARELVRDLKVGGVILFARNIETPAQVWQLTRDLQQEALAAGGPPLLIAVDQEGGPVQRLRAPFTLIPPARELGERSSPAQVAELSRKVARELALVGINVNLAPVLDVPRGPDCPLWDRCYATDTARVAAFGAAAVQGYLEGGVLPVAKHFPGLGDTVADSHQVLPRAQDAGAERENHLLPFRAALAAGAPLVMTAHLMVPAWDERPATLSPVALTQILRQKLGFEGVIITDDLEMGGITSQLSPEQGARAALAAGADLLLICNRPEAAWEAARLLAADPDLAPRGREAAGRLARLRAALRPPTAEFKEVEAYFGADR
jgi:beta-N-acetylhexosaminidase